MELQPFGVGVSIVYPPNTDTEGFAVEKEEMPEETRVISGSAGLFPAGEVAKNTISTIENGGFSATTGNNRYFRLHNTHILGLEGWMLRSLTSGASPEPNVFEAICQTLFGGLFRGIMLVYLGQFNSVVERIHQQKTEAH